MAAAWLAHALAVIAAEQKANIDWVSKPSEEDYLRFAPPAALRDKLDGRAVISCSVTTSGRMQTCKVESETPAGHGFGEAGLRLANLFQMRSVTSDNIDMVGARIMLPIRFRMSALPPAPLNIAAAGNEGQPPAPPPPPPSMAPPADVARFTPPSGRMASLGVVPGWQAYFLDLDRVTHSGRTVEVMRMTVFSRPRPVGTRQEVFAVSGLRLDCAAATHQSLGGQTFDAAGAPVGWSGPSAAAEANEAGSFYAMAAAQVCGAAAQTRPDANGASEAMAFAARALAER